VKSAWVFGLGSLVFDWVLVLKNPKAKDLKPKTKPHVATLADLSAIFDNLPKL
jgi:hypothetical protein